MNTTTDLDPTTLDESRRPVARAYYNGSACGCHGDMPPFDPPNDELDDSWWDGPDEDPFCEPEPDPEDYARWPASVREARSTPSGIGAPLSRPEPTPVLPGTIGRDPFLFDFPLPVSPGGSVARPQVGRTPAEPTTRPLTAPPPEPRDR